MYSLPYFATILRLMIYFRAIGMKSFLTLSTTITIALSKHQNAK